MVLPREWFLVWIAVTLVNPFWTQKFTYHFTKMPLHPYSFSFSGLWLLKCGRWNVAVKITLPLNRIGVLCFRFLTHWRNNPVKVKTVKGCAFKSYRAWVNLHEKAWRNKIPHDQIKSRLIGTRLRPWLNFIMFTTERYYERRKQKSK